MCWKDHLQIIFPSDPNFRQKSHLCVCVYICKHTFRGSELRVMDNILYFFANLSAAKWPLDCFLVFTSCIEGFCIILYPMTAFAFQSQLQAFLILQHSCYSVSSDKVYKERNKLVVVLLPCFFLLFFFFDGLVFYFWWRDVLQALLWILCVGRLHGSTQASLHCTNRKWHLSIFMFHAHKLLNHIIAEWKQEWLLFKVLYCNRKRMWLSLTFAVVISWSVWGA